MMRRLLYSLVAMGTIFCACSVPAIAEDVTAEDYVKFWEPFVGSWEMTTETPDGNISAGTFDFQVSRNKKCLLLYHGGKDQPFTQQLQGYDPVSKKQIAYGFWESGEFQIQTITVDEMKKGKIAAKGDRGSWELKVFGTDGKVTTATSKWTYDQLDKKKIVMLWSDIQEDGKPVPGKHKLTLER